MMGDWAWVVFVVIGFISGMFFERQRWIRNAEDSVDFIQRSGFLYKVLSDEQYIDLLDQLEKGSMTHGGN